MNQAQPSSLPRWAQFTLLPFINLTVALLMTAAVTAVLGESPIECLALLLERSLVHPEGICYTLFYTTTFIFTGLGVAAAFHAGLFNIGAEGQAYIGGLGVTLICLGLGQTLPAFLLLPLALIAALVFGGAWAWLPGYLQARRGSHIVVTTMMFNFISYALMLYLIAHVLIEPGSQNPTTRLFDEAAWLPTIAEIVSFFGWHLPQTPLNLSFLLALLSLPVFFIVVWRTRWGFILRTVGAHPKAADYAGMPVPRVLIGAMCGSGALAGLAAVNGLLGSAHRLNVSFTEGAGFVGIAVALMGRKHPVGIFFSALLFGALTQGGLELSMEKPNITPEMITFIQGVVILCCGALEHFFEPSVAAFLRQWSSFRRKQ